MKTLNSILLALALILALPTVNVAFSKTNPEQTANIGNMRVSLNKASVDQLTQLKGIGAKKAEAIVTYRDQHGPFKSISDLTNVKGIGAKFIEKNAEQLSL